MRKCQCTLNNAHSAMLPPYLGACQVLDRCMLSCRLLHASHVHMCGVWRLDDQAGGLLATRRGGGGRRTATMPSRPGSLMSQFSHTTQT